MNKVILLLKRLLEYKALYQFSTYMLKQREVFLFNLKRVFPSHNEAEKKPLMSFHKLLEVQQVKITAVGSYLLAKSSKVEVKAKVAIMGLVRAYFFNQA
jgi:hypothetical protein